MCEEQISCLHGSHRREVQLTSINADVAGVASHDTRPYMNCKKP
jgi:hypothetical protein